LESDFPDFGGAPSPVTGTVFNVAPVFGTVSGVAAFAPPAACDAAVGTHDADAAQHTAIMIESLILAVVRPSSLLLG
jgi:hypothetical protein